MGPPANPSSAVGPTTQGCPQGHLGPLQGPSGLPSSAQELSIPDHRCTKQGPRTREELGPGAAQPQAPLFQQGEEQLLGRADDRGNSLGSFCILVHVGAWQPLRVTGASHVVSPRQLSQGCRFLPQTLPSPKPPAPACPAALIDAAGPLGEAGEPGRKGSCPGLGRLGVGRLPARRGPWDLPASRTGTKGVRWHGGLGDGAPHPGKPHRCVSRPRLRLAVLDPQSSHVASGDGPGPAGTWWQGSSSPLLRLLSPPQSLAPPGKPSGCHCTSDIPGTW